MDKRRERRYPVSIEVGLREKGNDGIIGLSKDCSRSGLRAVFEHFESKPNSHLDLNIQKLNSNSFVPTAAEVIWKRPVEGKWEVGFRLRDFFLKDFLPGDIAVKPQILEDSYRERKWPSYLIKIISIMIAVFMIWYLVVTTGVVKRIRLDRIIRSKIVKVDMMWSLFRANLSAKMPKIFQRNYKINGIFYSTDESTHFIMINNNAYYPDDFVNGGKIINISQDAVRIQFPDKEVVYRLGDTIEP